MITYVSIYRSAAHSSAIMKPQLYITSSFDARASSPWIMLRIYNRCRPMGTSQHTEASHISQLDHSGAGSTCRNTPIPVVPALSTNNSGGYHCIQTPDSLKMRIRTSGPLVQFPMPSLRPFNLDGQLQAALVLGWPKQQSSPWLERGEPARLEKRCSAVT